MYKEIILVDDDRLINTLNTFLFKRMGLEDRVMSFHNPIEALDRLRSCTDIETKRLILLDINMPEMSGFEFLEHMEEENLPMAMEVIILTSSDSLADKEQAKKYSERVKDFISKPLLEENISHHLK